MTNLNTEEMQRIVDGVTDDCVTHISPRKNVLFSECIDHPLHNLNDLRTILSQQQEIERLRELLGAAACPCCDKSGAYYDNYGEIHQCQWCYEVNLKGESDE